MYPDLSYVLHDLFDTPVDNWTALFKTFGLFLVLAIGTSAWLLYIELRRKAQEGLFQPERVLTTIGKAATPFDLLSNAIFGFLLGYKILYVFRHMADFQLNPASLVLSLRGDWVGGILGALLFSGLRYWESQRRKLPQPVTQVEEVYPHHLIGDITIIAAVAGIAGAKIFDILEHFDAFVKNPLPVLFSGSGLAIYGGLIGGFLAVLVYLRQKKIPPVLVMDAVAPALIVGYGVGRLGCHFSGDGDWGIAAATQPTWWFLPDWLWAYDYPRNVINAGVEMSGCAGLFCHHLEPPVYPTPIYETLLALAIGALLWAWRRRMQTLPGMLFCWYLLLNGLERFWIEKIRINIRYETFGIQYTQAELVATVLMLLGAGGIILVWRRGRLRTSKAV
ncbi:MAG TPA: prolipoprotein diacylglyceryl transferase [Saprospiraceae bacterium]|nr:prolipoprotein diacylglyceryl transferase [Saprospiraceae bacterium]